MAESSYLSEEAKAVVKTYQRHWNPKFTIESWAVFVRSFRVCMLDSMTSGTGPLSHTLLADHAVMFDAQLIPYLVKDAFGIDDCPEGIFSVTADCKNGIKTVSISVDRGAFKTLLYNSTVDESATQTKTGAFKRTRKAIAPTGLSEKASVTMFAKECISKGAKRTVEGTITMISHIFVHEMFMAYNLWAHERRNAARIAWNSQSSPDEEEAPLNEDAVARLITDPNMFDAIITEVLGPYYPMRSFDSKNIVISNIACNISNLYCLPAPHYKLYKDENIVRGPKLNPGERRISKRPRRPTDPRR